jgi:hypothetical protein
MSKHIEPSDYNPTLEDHFHTVLELYPSEISDFLLEGIKAYLPPVST